MSKVIGCLGGGQLGRMLAQAASPLDIPVLFLDPDVNSPAKKVSNPELLPYDPKLTHVTGPFTSAGHIRQLAKQVDILTVEIEHVDVDALDEIVKECAESGGRSGKGIQVFPSPNVIRVIQDKYAQKLHLSQRGISVASFLKIESDGTEGVGSLKTSISHAGKTFGYPLMLKSRHLAYDGRGNFVLRSDSDSDVAAALDALIPSASIFSGKPLGERLYAEKFAPFVMEVAVMVVRGVDGQTRSYPAVETIHRDNVCHIVYAPLRPPPSASGGIGHDQRGHTPFNKDINENARQLAENAIDALGEGAIGVFGVEMFLMENGFLLLNEIAPRPHNSGHYTIESCQPSQYTSQLYAILSRTLPPIQFIPPAAGMLNLLGVSSSVEDDFKNILEHGHSIGASIHMYGKAGCRKGRKMGHITVLGQSDNEVRLKIAQLVEKLPGSYSEPIPSALTQTSPHKPFSSNHPLVSIIMGSDSDLPTMKPATAILTQFNIPYELSIVSAHRTPARMVEFANTVGERGIRVVIAGAGGAAHLPGMVASETWVPVIGVPVKGSSLEGVDSLYSIVQMPKGIPVATMAINNSTNAALLAARILASSGIMPQLQAQLVAYAKGLEDEVVAKIIRLENEGWDDYVVMK